MAKEKKATELTAEYIDTHLGMVHDYESFGKAIAIAVLSGAKEQLKKGPAVNNEVAVHLEFSVTPNDGRQCIFVKRGPDWVHVWHEPV